MSTTSDRTVESISAVRLTGIVKRFPGVLANDDVNLDVRWGEIHAIVGENGAGKSTLMKILYGMYQPDEGVMEVDGRAVRFRSPREAIAAGIGMVHQHFMLADNLSVAENIVLGSEPTRWLVIDFPGARRRISEVGEAYGLTIDSDTMVEDLGVGDRQRVEIVKVLYRGARIVILDEPTAVLVPQEVAELADNLRRLATEGHAIVLIDHKLDEVLAIADRVTVMRGGRSVATVTPSDVTARDLAELMVGSELPTPETPPRTGTTEPVLQVRGLGVDGEDGRRRVEEVDLSSSVVRSSASPGSKATVRLSSWQRSPVCCQRPAAPSCWVTRTSRIGRPDGDAKPGLATSPRTGNVVDCSSMRRSGRTSCSAIRRWPRSAMACLWIAPRRG